MSKQYGLILPGKNKPPTAMPQKIARPSIFDDSDSDEDRNAPPQLKPRTVTTQGPGAMERRIARKVQEKALEEDPTVFQYDELYDEMENKREAEKQTKALEPKKPKYITKLLETAERRKLENELRVERQVQKDREAEGEEFKDKETFVTAAYKKKLEEIRKMQEKDDREEYLESIGDVTKQRDLDGFYRHLYEQKLGTTKNQPTVTSAANDEVCYKPIRSGQNVQQRAYRKRHSSDSEEDAKMDTDKSTETAKVHLPNNIDADSDFSIDSSSSSSSSEEEDDDKPGPSKKRKTSNPKKDSKDDARKEGVIKSESKEAQSKSSDSDKKGSEKEKDKEKDKEKVEDDEKPSTSQQAQPKIDIWKKRTVGAVFEAALQRYLQRKAARNGKDWLP